MMVLALPPHSELSSHGSGLEVAGWTTAPLLPARVSGRSMIRFSTYAPGRSLTTSSEQATSIACWAVRHGCRRDRQSLDAPPLATSTPRSTLTWRSPQGAWERDADRDSVASPESF